MVIAYSRLMCAQNPSFRQGGCPVATEQQVFANCCRFAHHVTVLSKGDQSAIAFPAVSANAASRNYRLPYSLLQALCRDAGQTHTPNPGYSLTVFLGSNHYQTFPQSAAPSFPRFFSRYIVLAAAGGPLPLPLPRNGVFGSRGQGVRLPEGPGLLPVPSLPDGYDESDQPLLTFLGRYFYLNPNR